jgi:hypothetical protein
MTNQWFVSRRVEHYKLSCGPYLVCFYYTRKKSKVVNDPLTQVEQFKNSFDRKISSYERMRLKKDMLFQILRDAQDDSPIIHSCGSG